MKIFKRSVWCLLTVFFAIWFAVFIIAENATMAQAGWINKYLGINTYEVVKTEDEEEGDTRYYKSDYETVDENGNVIYNDAAMRENSVSVATQVATEGSVLLWNDGALPLDEGSKISLFGISSVDYLYHGGGSGEVTITTADTMKTACENVGLSVNNTLWSAYKLSKVNYGRGSKSGFADINYMEFTVGEVPWAALNSTGIGNIVPSLSLYGDAAVMMISRNSSETGDTDFLAEECFDNNYLDLAKAEGDVLNELGNLKAQGAIKKIILLLNTATSMSMKNIKNYDIDACLWVGYGGNASYAQIANLLSGRANPSGHLNNTFPYDVNSAPATENFGDFTFTEYAGVPATTAYTHNNKYVVYQEGVYVGYRYYETRYEDTVMGVGNANSVKGVKAGSGEWSYVDEVAYPFGYGLSYTTFVQSGFTVNEDGDNYEVSVTVKNTGDIAGKDVVQIYLQKPYTQYDKTNKVEKPSVELVGFAKTGELAPDDEQTLTVTVPKYEFKSYDTYGQGTYILEKGDYYLAAGTSAHDALNNVLAAKGYGISDGMDAAGNSAFAYKIVVESDDFETYSVSPYTGNEIANRFSDADVNLYSGTSGQEITYLSRNDWDATYPSAVTLTCTSPTMINDMQYGESPVADENDTMPVYGTVTSELGELTLAMLMDLDYNDELWEDLLNQLTWEEQVWLVAYGACSIAGATSISAPGAKTQDGPCGIRGGSGTLSTQMAFPCNGLVAATWNTELVEELGNAFGMEIMHLGYTGIYGTGANINRCAYGGRSWEYFSEDGFISGKMFAYETTGLQNRGIIVFTKHFVLNDQERNRYGGTVWANEQSIREIYLKAFEAGVTEGNANALMSSFNRIGCIWSGRHKGLLTDVLRGEWGFNGMVETDAGVGTHMLDSKAMAQAVLAGQDLWMTGGSTSSFNNYKDNATVCQAIRQACHRILYVQLHSNAMNGMAVGAKVIYITPWWQTAIKGAQIGFGIVTGICLIATVAAFVINAVKKRRIAQ